MSSGKVAAAVARGSPGSDGPPKPAGRRPRPRPDRGRRGGRPPERRRTRADHKRFHRKRRGGGAQESLRCSPPPRGGGLGAPGSRWRGTVAGEGRSGEERSSRRDGPEEDRGRRQERQSEEGDRRVEEERDRAEAEVAEEVVRDVEAGVERLGNGQADGELAGPEGHQQAGASEVRGGHAYRVTSADITFVRNSRSRTIN